MPFNIEALKGKLLKYIADRTVPESRNASVRVSLVFDPSSPFATKETKARKAGVAQSDALTATKCDIAGRILLKLLESPTPSDEDLLDYLFAQLKFIDTYRAENHPGHGSGEFEDILIGAIQALLSDKFCELTRTYLISLTCAIFTVRKEDDAIFSRWNQVLGYLQKTDNTDAFSDFVQKIQQGVFGLEGFNSDKVSSLARTIRSLQIFLSQTQDFITGVQSIQHQYHSLNAEKRENISPPPSPPRI